MVKSLSSRRLGVGAPLGQSVREAAALQQKQQPRRAPTSRASGANVMGTHVGTGSGSTLVSPTGSGLVSAPLGDLGLHLRGPWPLAAVVTLRAAFVDSYTL